MLTRCIRKDCFAYDGSHENLCAVLRKTYRDDFECPFYKTEDEVDGYTLEILEEARRNKKK